MSEETSKEPQEKKTKKKKSSKAADGKAKNGQEEVAKDKPADEQQPQEELKSPAEGENVAQADTKGNNEPTNPEGNEAEPDVKTEEPTLDEKTSNDLPAQPIENPVESGTSTEKPDKKDVIREMDLKKLQELKEAFHLFDINHDGFIDLEDLKYTFATLGKPDIPEEHLKQMLGEMPDPVDFDAFVVLFGHKITELDPEEVFTDALATWDVEGSGYISEERIKDDLRRFGDRFTPDEIDCALEEAPVYVQKGTPMIDYVQFGSNVCGLRNVEKSRQFQKVVESGET